jgi:hypothetical protein
MNKLKIILFIFITYFLYLNNMAFATINFTVSPIKYEIEAFTGTTVSKSSILRNNSNVPVHIITWKSDFQSNWSTWLPQFVRYSELVHPDQQLSTRINIDTDEFTINPNEEKTINFTLSIPDDATPGWHYWAICFKNKKSEISTTWNIGINVDYCVIMLVNIDWEVITKAEVKDTVISVSWWAGWWLNSWNNGINNWKSNSSENWNDVGINNIVKDKCPVIDLTASNFDWKCIDNFFNKDDLKDDIKNLKLDEKIKQNDINKINNDDFVIDFSTLFINEWNTHLSPNWDIKLVDKNGKVLKWIWKESIKNEEWAKIWEKIVDYLPVNDEWWNVLPSQKREFNASWKWFPYEAYDENWKKIIKYWTPEEYYTLKNVQQNGYLMPWERVCERINKESLNAKINIFYVDKKWEKVEFNSSKIFDVYYKEKYIWINPYVFLWALFLIFVIYLLWLIFRKKKIKCISCKKKIDKDMLICPYCWAKQDDKIFERKKRGYKKRLVKISKQEEKENKIDKIIKKVDNEDDVIKKTRKRVVNK